MERTKKFYRALVNTAHSGKGKSGSAYIYVEACDAFDAMKMAGIYAGVKRKKGMKGATVIEITEEEYQEGVTRNREYGYLKTPKYASTFGQPIGRKGSHRTGGKSAR